MDEIVEGERVEATDERGQRRIGKVVRVGAVRVDKAFVGVLDIVWEDDETLSNNIPADGAEKIE